MNKTYTIFGDSIAKGIISNNSKIQNANTNSVKLIEDFFNIKINNISKYGLSLSKFIEKNMLDNYITNLDKTKTNFVFFCLGGNDADFNWKEVGENPFIPHSMKTPLSTFSKMLDEVVKKLKENNVIVVLSTIMPINSNLYFKNVISKIADGKNVLKYLENDLTNIHRVQECYNNEIIKCALRNNCELLDVRTPMVMTRDYMKYFCEDGIHPNQEGYNYLAQLYIIEIMKIKNKLTKEISTDNNNLNDFATLHPNHHSSEKIA